MADLTPVERVVDQTDTRITLLLERIHLLEEDNLNLQRYYENEILELRQQLATYEDCPWENGLNRFQTTAEFKLLGHPALQHQQSGTAAANHSTSSPGLRSLPTELLDLICQYADVKSCLQPGRRLYIPPSCYYCTSFPLFEVPCPALLRCCRDLHRRLIPLFYENTAVVVEFDFRRCEHGDSLTKLLSRRAILRYIHNIDLAFTTSARDRAADDPGHFWREPHLVGKLPNPGVYCRVDPEVDFGNVISTIKANLPNLNAFSWTIKITWGDIVCLNHTEADDGSSGYATNDYGPPFLIYYRSPFSILEEHLPGTRGHNSIPSLRVWLARSIIHKIARDLEWHIYRRRAVAELVSEAELASFLRQLTPLTSLIELFPHIDQFDLFHGLGQRSGFFASLKRHRTPRPVMRTATSVQRE